MKNLLIFNLGNLLVSPTVLLFMANGVFLNVLGVFYAIFLIVAGKRYFRAFWRKYFRLCLSFDLFLKNQVAR